MLMYILVGVALGIVATILVLRYQKAELAGGKLVGVCILWLIGLILIGFACAWAIAAIQEAEPQSAAMGLLVFGGIGAIFAIIGFRLGMPAKPKEDAPAETA